MGELSIFKGLRGGDGGNYIMEKTLFQTPNITNRNLESQVMKGFFNNKPLEPPRARGEIK